jgi:lysophospholipase L1-like esterase
VPTPICEAPTTIRQIKSGWWTPVAFVGGSLTVGTGSSNTAVTSWRRLFMRHMHDRYETTYNCRIGEVMVGIGAMGSSGMSFMLPRYVPKKKPTLVFIEHCVNDNGTKDTDLVRKGIEGLIRQVRSIDTNPDVVLLCAAVRTDSDASKRTHETFDLYRDVARHYGVACLDIDAWVQRTLSERGQTWDAVGIDHCHMNDYGNHMWFECLREWFEDQVRIYEQDPSRTERPAGVPGVLFSDELEHTRLVPVRKGRRIALEGDWRDGDDVCLPWWIDHMLVGRPGARLTYTFTGTAIGTVTMMQPNGLKLEAVLDGKEVVGPYTNWVADFCRVELMAHGMENREHVLELSVSAPQRGKNQEDPTARVAYFCVAAKTADEE